VREQYLRHPLLSSIDAFKHAQTNTYRVEAEYLTSDPLDDTYIKTVAPLTVDPTKGFLSTDSNLVTLHDSVSIQKYSPSGNIKATVKMGAEGATIEIFKNGVLWYRKPVPPTAHLMPVKSWVFMTDHMHFSEDESRFMYMAEDPAPMINVYKLKDIGVTRFKYRDSIGDRLTHHPNPTIFIFDMGKRELFRVNKPLESSKQRIIYMHPQFADAQGNSIICTAINMIGVSDQTFFFNYPKQLTYITGLTVEKSIKGQTGNKLWWVTPTPLNRGEIQEEVAFFPKMSPDFKRVSYFFNQKCQGPSLNSCGLRVMNLEGFSTETILEEVEEDGPVFTGIQGFHLTLGRYNWLNSDTILLNSAHHQSYHIYEIKVSSKAVSRVIQGFKFLPSESDLFLTKLDNNLFLGKRDCFYKNGVLFVARKNEDGTYTELGCEQLGDLKEFEMFDEVITVNGIEGTFFGRSKEGEEVKKRPVILLIHGGPHGIWHTYHTPMLYHHVKNNHAVLNINYTGSTGRGNKFARNLCGKAGDIEINEVKNFVDHMIKEGKIDPAQIKVSSGSYGGFIALTLLQRYPDLIKCASIFNPVSNGFSMWLGSSVYKWLDAEFLNESERPYKFTYNLTEEESLLVKEKSPMFGDYNFKAEVLFFLGLKDDVVPPLSTRHLFKKLRSTKHRVQLYEYPDEEHMILMIGPNFDYTIKTCLLFDKKHPFN
jgi:acylaminoacyl-peptidase